MDFSTKNVNNNNFTKSCKPDTMAYDDHAATEVFLQNSHNANQLNNGQTDRNRSSSFNSLLTAGSKRKFILCCVVGIVLLAGIVAVFASFAMLGALSHQRLQIRSLESQLNALKEEHALCKNETASLGLQLTTCEKELQGAQHQIEINSAQCELEKGNITARMAAEILKGEHEKQIMQEKLSTCEGNKETLSQQLDSQTRNAEAEKRGLTDRLDTCQQEKREISRRRDEEAAQWAAERASAVAAKSSSVVEPEPSWRSSSRSNGAERTQSLQTAIFFSTMLLSLQFKVLHVL